MAVCLEPGCPAIVDKGRCPEHERNTDRTRRQQRNIDYSESWWRRFRNVDFPALLIDAGIIPACGSALPSGPNTTDSQCKADGRQVTTMLQLDHEPPLEDWEQRIRSRVCDPDRVQYLCASCHSRKTIRQLTRHESNRQRT